MKTGFYKDFAYDHNLWGFEFDFGPVSFVIGQLASGGFGISGGYYVAEIVHHLEISTAKVEYTIEDA